MQSLPGSNALQTTFLCQNSGFLELWLWEVLQRKCYLPTNSIVSPEKWLLVKELWICVGLFLFATSAAWNILRKVNWPLSSPGHWQDAIHNECTSSSQCSSMSVLTSDPIATNSVRQRRYLTSLPRGQQLPTGVPDRLHVHDILHTSLVSTRRIMDPILHLIECSSFAWFVFFTVHMICIAVWAVAKVPNLLVLSRFVMISHLP